MAQPVMQVRRSGRLLGGFLALAGLGLLIVFVAVSREVGPAAIGFGLILMALGSFGAMPGRRFIQADADGVTVVQWFKPQRLEWTDIKQVSLELQPVRESSLAMVQFRMSDDRVIRVPLAGFAGKPERIVGALNAVRENRFHIS